MMSLFRSGAVLILSILLLEVSRTRAKAGLDLPYNFFDEVKTKLTWSVYPKNWSSPELSAEIKNAFDFWENHTRFTFGEVSLTGSPATIRIHILRDLEEPYSVFTEKNKRKTAVARTMYDPKEQSGVVFVTGYETWKHFSNRNKNALNITSVVKHQLGYILGQKDTAAFSSTMTPSSQITNISNLTKEEKASYFFDIEVNDVMTVINESYQMPQAICKPNIDLLLHNIDIPYEYLKGKYLYNILNDTVAAVRDYWPQLPENLRRIDGVYGDPRGFQVFFIGDQAYAINNTESFAGPSCVLNNWLKKEGVNPVDFVFRHDTGMYVVRGETCWKFVQESVDSYTIRNVRVDFSTVHGYKEAIIEGKHYERELRLRDQEMFDWLGFTCQPGHKRRVPEKCCTL